MPNINRTIEWSFQPAQHGNWRIEFINLGQGYAWNVRIYDTRIGLDDEFLSITINGIVNNYFPAFKGYDGTAWYIFTFGGPCVVTNIAWRDVSVPMHVVITGDAMSGWLYNGQPSLTFRP